MKVGGSQRRRFYWRFERVRGEGFNGGLRGSGEKVSMEVGEGQGRKFNGGWRGSGEKVLMEVGEG